MGIVVFVVLIVFMTDTHGPPPLSMDLPKVLHPVMVRGADREDAMKVATFATARRILAPRRFVSSRLKDREVERTAYTVADLRGWWGALALVSVRNAGTIRVAILAEKGQLPKLAR